MYTAGLIQGWTSVSTSNDQRSEIFTCRHESRHQMGKLVESYSCENTVSAQPTLPYITWFLT